MLWGLSLTLLCKDKVSAVVDWCCWAGGAGEPWLLENTQETKQGKYITAYCQITYTQKKLFQIYCKSETTHIENVKTDSSFIWPLFMHLYLAPQNKYNLSLCCRKHICVMGFP